MRWQGRNPDGTYLMAWSGFTAFSFFTLFSLCFFLAFSVVCFFVAVWWRWSNSNVTSSPVLHSDTLAENRQAIEHPCEVAKANSRLNCVERGRISFIGGVVEVFSHPELSRKRHATNAECKPEVNPVGTDILSTLSSRPPIIPNINHITSIRAPPTHSLPHYLTHSLTPSSPPTTPPTHPPPPSQTPHH